MPSHTVKVYQYLLKLKGWRLQKQKQNTYRHRIRMREKGGSLNFNFILLPSPMVNKNWVYQHIIYCTVYLRKNDAVYDWNFLWTSFICSLLNCEYCCSQVTPSFLLLAISSICSLILGYALEAYLTHTLQSLEIIFWLVILLCQIFQVFSHCTQKTQSLIIFKERYLM